MAEVKGEYGWKNAGSVNAGRDYELFSVLAGVRNSDGIRPIAEPRGIPEDACSEFVAWSESWNGDGHSHSWVTLAEMKAYDLTQEIDDTSLVLSRDKAGKITSTCSATNGKHLGPVGRRTIFGIWGTAHWDGIIAAMEKVKPEGGTDEDVRLCFFFDN